MGFRWHGTLNCNTESLQGSSFSLEEELSSPENPLESLLENLRPRHFCTRQQRQQQMWNEEGPPPVPAATVWQKRYQKCQGDKPVLFRSSICTILGDSINKFLLSTGAKGKDMPA